MKPLYLEPDEEITTVIEKLTAISDRQVAVVVPKNSPLFQSLVNLKLLVKEADRLGKQVAIISSDKIGARLAKQVGVTVYASLQLGSPGGSPVAADQTVSPPTASQETVIDGVKVRQYVPPTGATPPPSPGEPMATATTSEPPPEPSPQSVPIEPEPSPGEVEPKETVLDQSSDLPTIVSRARPTWPRPSIKLIVPWKSVGVAGFLTVIALAAVYLFLPKATLTLTFKAEPLTKELALAVETIPSPSEEAIAGSQLIVERTGETTITASGKKDIGQKATGEVKITNKYRDANGVGKDQTWAAGAALTDNSSKRVFTLNQAVSVGRVTYDPNSGAVINQSKTVGVSAEAPGEGFNLAAGATFSLTGALANTEVTNSQGLTGGSSQPVTVLTQEDIDRSTAELKGTLLSQAKIELNTKANGQFLLPEAIVETVKTDTLEAKVGDVIDSTTRQLTVEYLVIVYDSSQLIDRLKTALLADLGADKDLELPTDQVTVKFRSIADDRSTMSILATGNGFAVPKLDKNQLAKSVRHRSIDQAIQVIKDAVGPQQVAVEIIPGWWPNRLPILAGSISVEYSAAN